MKWPLMLSRPLALAWPDCGTQARPVLTQLAVVNVVLAIVASVRRIVGTAPHVTATLVESVVALVEGSGPRINSASPTGGGVRLSRSAGRNPNCWLVWGVRFALCI